MDCSHRRFDGLPSGLLPPAYCSIRRKIAPLTARVTGVDEFGHILALGLFDHRVQAALVLSTGLRSKYGGITAGWQSPLAALHVKLLGAWISTRWLTALVTT